MKINILFSIYEEHNLNINAKEKTNQISRIPTQPTIIKFYNNQKTNQVGS